MSDATYENAYREYLRRRVSKPNRKHFSLSRRKARAIRWKVEGIK